MVRMPSERRREMVDKKNGQLDKGRKSEGDEMLELEERLGTIKEAGELLENPRRSDGCIEYIGREPDRKERLPIDVDDVDSPQNAQ